MSGLHVRLYQTNLHNSTMIIVTIADDCFLLDTENWPILILHGEIYYSIQNNRKKIIGHHTHFRENDDSPLWRGPSPKKKPLFFNARALITREIMRSRDAQCNTGE